MTVFVKKCLVKNCPSKSLRLNYNKMINKFFFIFLCFLCTSFIFANNNPKTIRTISSAQIAEKVSQHIFNYSHFKIIGTCVWLQCRVGHCATVVTPELDEYLPDLIVSVYRKKDGDPFWEAKKSIDPIAHKAGSKLFEKLLAAKYHFKTHVSLKNGNISALNAQGHYNSIRRKSVDVIGAPLSLFHIPFLMLRINTTAYIPYYISDLDTLGRIGIAESIRPETYLPTHVIGQSILNHWSYEFPRNMMADVYNNYKASVIVALHAADIVTNHNALHTVKSTTNSCGHNCVVSNVIEEQKDKHEIWQEVYPYDRHVQIGQSDNALLTSLGNKDDQKGHGRYVFVIWRHYRGCIQANKGRLIFKSINVGHPVKR